MVEFGFSRLLSHVSELIGKLTMSSPCSQSYVGMQRNTYLAQWWWNYPDKESDYFLVYWLEIKFNNDNYFNFYFLINQSSNFLS